MGIKPFSEKTTLDLIAEQRNKVEIEIDGLTNEEVMANDTEVLAENMYQKYYLVPVTLFEEDYEKRKIEPRKIRKRADSITLQFYGKEYIEVDGFEAEFHYPYSGDRRLFDCRPTIFSLGGYPEIEVSEDDIVIKLIKSIKQVEHVGKERLLDEVKCSIDDLKKGIGHVNADVDQFNKGLKLFAWKRVNEKKSKVEAFFNLAKMLEVPIEKTNYYHKHIEIERKIAPIAHSYNSEDYYDIKDSDYQDILSVIKHTASTYERTPSSYKSMHEEDLRNTLLAALNGIYKGDANGETFRNNGKTDICIERKNRAAFVAECKMWTGAKEVEKALSQLDSYLTWRDCKTALIFFVRNKDFFGVLEKAKEALRNIEGMRAVHEKDKNEFDCLFLSKSNVGQQVKVRVLLFNIFYEND